VAGLGEQASSDLAGGMRSGNGRFPEEAQWQDLIANEHALFDAGPTRLGVWTVRER
jgi:hypothetical protein